jgi:protein-S-isoprenylcysteine O-methyltransferase Ste14
MQHSGFGWLLLATAIYGVIHSTLASHAVKAWVERRLGARARRMYRLFFVAVAFVSFLPLLALTLWLPDRAIYTIPFPWVFLTVAAQGVSVICLLLTLAQTDLWAFMGLRQVSQPEPLRAQTDPSRLVTSGFYRYVRHPLYTFTLVILWLMPVVSWNSLALVAGLTVYLFIGTLLEERKLVEEFGEPYRLYRRSTPMVFPKILKG